MRRVRELLLTVGAVLGAVCLLVGVVAVTAGVHVLVFRSGSMSPTIETGDLALTRTVNAAELAADDVVSVIDSNGNRVTHRIVNLAEQGDERQLTLKGDANGSPDREVYTVTDAQRVVFVVPKAGYLVTWSTGPVGLVLLGGYGAFLLSVLLRGKDRGDGDPPPPARRTPPKRRAARRGAPALLAVALGGVLAATPTPGWAAPWTDQVTVSAGVSAHQVAAPDSTSCSTTSSAATMSWPEKDPRYDYEVVLKRANGTTVSTRQVTGSGLSTTYNAPGDFGFGILALGTYTFTVEVRSYLAASTSWRGTTVRVSSQSIQVTIISVLFIPVLGSIDCV